MLTNKQVKRISTDSRSGATRSNGSPLQTTAQRSVKYGATTSRIVVLVIVCITTNSMWVPRALSQAANAVHPTAENALAADEELAHAIRDNDANTILRMLDASWAVIATTGDIGEGPSVFPNGIESGHLTRKTYELSEPRVRIYGDIAVVTSKVETSGVLQGKPFDVVERQTDVLHWTNSRWKCVLTHETKIKNN
jgi:ketosteroid isomerase-like protein